MHLDDYDYLVFFDTETTGLNARENFIIELACVRVSAHGIYKTDRFIKLPAGVELDEKITDLTGITELMLSAEGVKEEEAAREFGELISGGKTLLIAHNANFDLSFTGNMLIRYIDLYPDYLKAFCEADYLDTLTVYKDRRAYPHKLKNAIEEYGLSDKVQNSHRAIDDTLALYEVFKAMRAERDDLADYINIFGYNPKYGISGEELKKVTYAAQPFRDYMTVPEYILPARVKKEENNNGNT